MSDIKPALRALVTRILEGKGMATPTDRRAAFDDAAASEPQRTFVEKVAKHANEVTDADFAALRASGLNEDPIFEIVVCAAIGQAARQYETARAALDAASKE